MPKVFISYRRNDSGAYAGRVYDNLRGRFGSTHVFMDIDKLRPGDDFAESLPSVVASCDTLVALIGKRWLYVKDRDGRRRLDRSDDLVRVEISTALSRGLRVIPVLINGARMPPMEGLPDCLKSLTQRHAINVTDETFKTSMASVVRTIKGAAPSDIYQDREKYVPNERSRERLFGTAKNREETIRILVADDHTIVRHGLKLILSARSEFRIVGEAANGREAVHLARKLKPHVVLMDLDMPDMNGLQATEAILESTKRVRVLILSMHNNPTYIRRALRLGAIGYVLKDAIDNELVNAIHSVARGNEYISPKVSKALLTESRANQNAPIKLLSGRERKVFQLIVQGNTQEEIATRLNLSVVAVDSHRGKIMKKLNLHSRGQLVLFAATHGLVE
ncbi:MAG TPA: response regulator [Bryobacteraceae bacterium]|jgi:two-component system response regulator NreC|nr:response regulator [Bryobacteraceae bacterium]